MDGGRSAAHRGPGAARGGFSRARTATARRGGCGAGLGRVASMAGRGRAVAAAADWLRPARPGGVGRLRARERSERAGGVSM